MTEHDLSAADRERLTYVAGWLRERDRGMDVDDFVAHLADMLAAARQEARDEAVAPVLALAEEWERSPWDWLRTTAAPALRTALADADTTARDRASIEELVERSSLGTPAAKAARASVSDEDAARIVARARKIDAGAHDRDVAAEALEAAAEATVMEWRPVFYEDDNDEWANDKVARWLRARAAAVRQGGEHRG